MFKIFNRKREKKEELIAELEHKLEFYKERRDYWGHQVARATCVSDTKSEHNSLDLCLKFYICYCDNVTVINSLLRKAKNI